MTEIQAFSGTRPWHPTVLVDTDAHEAGTADGIIEAIDSGLCPRCEGPLPKLPEFPAGSRITKCRSIPICGRCGGDEVRELIEDGGYSSAGCWPLPHGEIAARIDRCMSSCRVETAILSGDQVITSEGAAPLMNPCNTGGWAEYGYEGQEVTR